MIEKYAGFFGRIFAEAERASHICSNVHTVTAKIMLYSVDSFHMHLISVPSYKSIHIAKVYGKRRLLIVAVLTYTGFLLSSVLPTCSPDIVLVNTSFHFMVKVLFSGSSSKSYFAVIHYCSYRLHHFLFH